MKIKLQNKRKEAHDELFLQKGNKGFSLIELMVATSIFMIIMLVALGALLMTSGAAKESNALNFTMDNLSFATESMSRSLRMGTNYTCANNFISLNSSPAPADCSNGGNIIAFKPAGSTQANHRIAYKLISNNGHNTIERCDTKANPECVSLLAPNINVDVLKFYVKGALVNENIQPSVYILLRGSVLVKGKKLTFAIQTMASQRTIE